MRSLINILDLSVEELNDMMDVADDIIANPKKYAEVCHGKKLATLFYEPSTRTRLSFEAAMMELGGNVLGFSEPSLHCQWRLRPCQRHRPHRSCQPRRVVS